ncbi:MAG: hypothetical protein JO078_05660 [Candidatus Eremiobacteraeota bacterium]|nr:hypothetical protein [Candidatus Eremiobacteraeota bacterium]MBV9056319.1 hypothetical protein [Candidatus Eremiobacteraeota bacterium]MBV9699595.1 hypothetical protein [Candidatus Eremiobacteraeota bacterium]
MTRPIVLYACTAGRGFALGFGLGIATTADAKVNASITDCTPHTLRPRIYNGEAQRLDCVGL